MGGGPGRTSVGAQAPVILVRDRGTRISVGRISNPSGGTADGPIASPASHDPTVWGGILSESDGAMLSRPAEARGNRGGFLAAKACLSRPACFRGVLRHGAVQEISAA